MLDQAGLVSEALPAVRAVERFIPCVDSLVLDEVYVDTEALPTVDAFVGLLFCVDLLVAHQLGALGEDFPTLDADIQLLVRLCSVADNGAFALPHAPLLEGAFTLSMPRRAVLFGF